MMLQLNGEPCDVSNLGNLRNKQKVQRLRNLTPQIRITILYALNFQKMLLWKRIITGHYTSAAKLSYF
jgi:hypothetical protein